MIEPPDDAWFRSALTETSDIVFVLDAATTVVWCNPAVDRLGYEPDAMVGRSMAEFVHPDDLVRAAEVIELETSGVFSRANPITPALYNVRAADGSWVPLEINASATAGDDRLLVVGRIGGDLVILDRLLESVTADEPIEHQVELVGELATWRHPNEGYAISYLDADGERRWHTENLPRSLYDPDIADEVLPWEAEIGSEPEVVALGPTLRAAADQAGFVDCLVARVDDPSHADGARILIWTTRVGPTVSGHRYAMTNMRRALALVLQRRAHLDLLQWAVRVDQLTGVTSRTRLMELIEEADAGRDGTARCVLYLDLDGFKGVNDSLGHMIGDRVLKEAARRLSQTVPVDSTFARMGGDEFVVLCPPGTDAEEAAVMAQGLVDSLAEPLLIDREALGVGPTDLTEPVDPIDHGDSVETDPIRVSIGVSVGLAVGHPGEPLSSVLDAADEGLFKAKGEGRGRWVAVADGSPE